MATTETIHIGESRVTIDPNNLRFNEATLSQYIQHEAGFYDNFGAYLAMAERNLQVKELKCEKLYSLRFSEFKDRGGSDKLADARAKADHDVVAAREEVIDAKYIVKRLQQHLRAWDKNHDNAQSMGHMLRKEMDKMHPEIFARGREYHTWGTLDKMVEDTVGCLDPDEVDERMEESEEE